MAPKRKRESAEKKQVAPVLTDKDVNLRTSKLRRMLHEAKTKDDLVSILGFVDENPLAFDFKSHDANLRPGLIVQRYVECIARVGCTVNKLGVIRDRLLNALVQNSVFDSPENCNLYLALLANTTEELVTPSRFLINQLRWAGDLPGLFQCITHRTKTSVDEKALIVIMTALDTESYIFSMAMFRMVDTNVNIVRSLLETAVRANSASVLEYLLHVSNPCSDVHAWTSPVCQPLLSSIDRDTSDAVKDLVWTSEKTTVDWYSKRKESILSNLNDLLLPELASIVCVYLARFPFGTISIP